MYVDVHCTILFSYKLEKYSKSNLGKKVTTDSRITGSNNIRNKPYLLWQKHNQELDDKHGFSMTVFFLIEHM